MIFPLYMFLKYDNTGLSLTRQKVENMVEPNGRATASDKDKLVYTISEK